MTHARRLSRQYPLALIALGTFLYSTGPVFVQASEVSGPVFSFWRLWFGVGVFGIAMTIQARITGRWPDPVAWRWAAYAGLAFGIHQLLLFSAVKATSVADVTLVNTLSPIVTGIMAIPMFQERPGPAFRGWSLVAMAGAGVVVLGASAGPEGSPLGMTLALGNVFTFAAFFLLSKRSRDHLPVLPFLFGVMVVAAVTVTGYVGATGASAGTAEPTDLLYALIVAAGPGFVGHFVMTWPLRWVPANIPPVFRLAIPIMASVWAWWFLGESITLIHLLGGAITIGGTAGAVLSRSGRRLMAREQGDAEPDHVGSGR